MKKVLVIGASGHSKVIIDIIELQKKYEIVGLVDSFKNKTHVIYNYNVLGTEKDISQLIKAHNIYGFIMAIGFSLVLILLGGVRELLGQGTLFDGAPLLLGEWASVLRIELVNFDESFLFI